MSKYTTEVRFICESLAGFDMSQGYNKVNDVIDNSWDKIFDFDFPIWDENYKSVLCKKILKHYYTREIGLETYGLWKLKLDTLMNEIMPYYNSRYQTTILEFNPLYDVDYTKTTNGQEDGDNSRTGKDINSGSDTNRRSGTVESAKTGTENVAMTGTVGVQNSSSGTNENVDRFSDTPQGGLVGVRNDNYLTSARIINGQEQNSESGTTTYNRDNETTHNTKDTTTYNVTDTLTKGTQVDRTESGEFSTTKEYVEHIIGKTGNRSYYSVINEMRDSIINIDLEVINALSELFMKIW